MHRGWYRLFSNFLHLHVKEHSWIPCQVTVGIEASTIPTQGLNVELLMWTFQSVNFKASLKCFFWKMFIQKSWKPKLWGSVSVCLFCLSCWSVDYPSSKHMSKWLQSGVHDSEGSHLWQPGAEWRCGYFFPCCSDEFPSAANSATPGLSFDHHTFWYVHVFTVHIWNTYSVHTPTSQPPPHTHGSTSKVFL